MSIPITCNKCKKFLKDYELNEHINVSKDGRYLCDECDEKEMKAKDEKNMDKILR